jgi:cell fate regulator YaaT (PSP1 superfamily)
MCCIAYENTMYQELKEEVPGVGDFVKTPKCDRCRVMSVDYLRKIVKTDENGDGMPAVYASKEVQKLEKSNRTNAPENESEDLNAENE